MSTITISPKAPYGSLLKTGLPPSKKSKPKDGKDKNYLKAIRGLPCLACGKTAEAAHVRIGEHSLDKHPAMQKKPEDRWCLPLCHDHHMEQHIKGGEVSFWNKLGIHPLDVCAELYAAYPDEDAMLKIIKGASRTV